MTVRNKSYWVSMLLLNDQNKKIKEGEAQQW